MHFIHKISWFEYFLHKTSSVFQKFHFSRFSIDQGCFSTDQKCVKIFGLNLSDSIGARSIESIFWLIEAQFRPIEIRKLSFMKIFSSCVLHYFKSFFKLFLTFSLRPIQSKDFVIFFHKFLQGFCPQALVSLLYPFFFNLITCFTHFHAFFFFFLKNLNIAI